MKTLGLSFVGMKLMYLPLVLVALGSLLPAVTPALAQTWTLTDAPSNSWHAVAISADGTKLVAVASAGPIFFSTNSGDTWTPAAAPAQDWYSAASSADGTRLVATASFSTVYTSTNSGATWTTATNAPYTTYWSSVASSADGSRLVVGSYDSVHHYGSMVLSGDSGSTWDALTNAPPAVAIASSADGTKLVAGAGSFATSTNSGATWTDTGVLSGFWNSVASSANGNKLAGVNYGDNGLIYASSDSGATWMTTSAPGGNWISVASSADGSKLVAAQGGGLFIPGPGFGGPIYTSSDAGSTWTSNNVPNAFAVAAAADGGKLVAAACDGGIYISQTAVAPVLSIARAGSNLVVSWTVPSTKFVLQENSELRTTNWMDVTAATTLNFSTLQNQVTMPFSTSNRYFRLRTP